MTKEAGGHCSGEERPKDNTSIGEVTAGVIVLVIPALRSLRPAWNTKPCLQKKLEKKFCKQSQSKRNDGGRVEKHAYEQDTIIYGQNVMMTHCFLCKKKRFQKPKISKGLDIHWVCSITRVSIIGIQVGEGDKGRTVPSNHSLSCFSSKDVWTQHGSSGLRSQGS